MFDVVAIVNILGQRELQPKELGVVKGTVKTRCKDRVFVADS